MAIKELIFGPNDETNNVKAALIFEDYEFLDDYEFKTDDKSLKEFEEELGIERNHNRLPWEVK